MAGRMTGLEKLKASRRKNVRAVENMYGGGPTKTASAADKPKSAPTAKKPMSDVPSVKTPPAKGEKMAKAPASKPPAKKAARMSQAEKFAKALGPGKSKPAAKAASKPSGGSKKESAVRKLKAAVTPSKTGYASYKQFMGE